MRKFEKVSYNNTGILPTRSDTRSAGYDIYSTEDKWIYPNSMEKFITNIKVYMEPDEVLMIYPRSGLGFKYYTRLANSTGIIDSDYYYSDNEGHIFIKMTNDSNEGKTVEVAAGTGFAQGIFLEYGITVDDAAEGIRNGGFGSTTAK